MSSLCHRPFNKGQQGTGFLSDFKNAIVNTSNKLSNLVPASDSNARPLFPGEIHTVLKLPGGGFGRANYMGPGTALVDRLKRGDPPRTFSDKESQAHDSRYALANSQAGVRKADLKMIDVMKRGKRDSRDSNFNLNQGLHLIQAKHKLEEVTGKSFVSFGGIAGKDRPLVQNKLNELEKQGFGRCDLPPSARLRKKLQKQVKSSKKNTYRVHNYNVTACDKKPDMIGGANIMNLMSEKLSKLLLPLLKAHVLKKFKAAK
jgi:hypothetical protein